MRVLWVNAEMSSMESRTVRYCGQPSPTIRESFLPRRIMPSQKKMTTTTETVTLTPTLSVNVHLFSEPEVTASSRLSRSSLHHSEARMVAPMVVLRLA